MIFLLKIIAIIIRTEHIKITIFKLDVLLDFFFFLKKVKIPFDIIWRRELQLQRVKDKHTLIRFMLKKTENK